MSAVENNGATACLYATPMKSNDVRAAKSLVGGVM